MVNIPKRSISSLETSSSETAEEAGILGFFLGARTQNIVCQCVLWPRLGLRDRLSTLEWVSSSVCWSSRWSEKIPSSAFWPRVASRCRLLPVLFSNHTFNQALAWMKRQTGAASQPVFQTVTVVNLPSDTQVSSAQAWWAMRAQSHTWINLEFLWRVASWWQRQTRLSVKLWCAEAFHTDDFTNGARKGRNGVLSARPRDVCK